MLDVGAGVGYLRKAFEVAWRFDGRGSPGDEESGSNAGSNEGADLFTPAVEGRVGSRALVSLEGEESMAKVGKVALSRPGHDNCWGSW